MKLSDEDQCMLDMMEITGFPVELEHGLYTYDLDVLAKTTVGFHVCSGIRQTNKRATADIKSIVKLFERWKEERNEN